MGEKQLFGGALTQSMSIQVDGLEISFEGGACKT